jgi:hypothetical protein
MMAHATVGYFSTEIQKMEEKAYYSTYNGAKLIRSPKRGYRGKGGRAIKKGDCLLTDCNVTGTDIGTPDNSPVSLRGDMRGSWCWDGVR